MRHELWVESDGLLFCLVGSLGEGARKLLSKDAKLVWTVEAESHFEAMTKYYEYMDWGEYRSEFPELDKKPTKSGAGSKLTAMKVAAFQKRHSEQHLQQRIQVILRDFERCDAEGVDIVCFPECYLTGYYLGLEAITRHAVSPQGPEFREFLKVCSSFKTTVIIGFIEKTSDGFFNAAAVISRGKLLGCYRKTHPNEKHFLPGKDFPIFQQHGATFGINICNDANYPDAAFALSKQGASIIFFPLNNMLPKDIASKWRDKSPENLCLRARETKTWVVSSDVTGRSDDCLSYGCTQIVSPEGESIVSVPEQQEGFVSFQINLFSS